jgi:outer membrane protein
MTNSLFEKRSAFTAVLLAAGLLWGGAATVQAQSKFAVVDLQKIFEGYYKTKQADTQLRERGADAEKQYKGMLEDYSKANDEYKKLVESANDQAVAADEREKRKKSAESKVLELNEIEKSLTQFRREKQATFDEQKMRMRDQIVREIREVVNNKARTGGYTMILDSSAKSFNQVPFILFNAGPDLTDEVLSQMNVGAPPGVLDADTKGAKGDIKLNIPEPEKEKEKPARKR